MKISASKQEWLTVNIDPIDALKCMLPEYARESVGNQHAQLVDGQWVIITDERMDAHIIRDATEKEISVVSAINLLLKLW